MSLRLRLILAFATLMLLLGISAAWGLHLLGRELQAATDETALRVGTAVVTVLRQPGADEAATPPVPAPRIERRVVIDRRELSAEEVERHRLPEPPRFRIDRSEDGQPLLFVQGGPGAGAVVPLPDAAQAAVARFTRQLGIGLLLLFALGVLAAAWIAARITRPLATLARAADALGRGVRDVPLTAHGPPEVRDSIVAFAHMRAELARLDAEATRARADRELAELGEIGRGLAHSLRNPLHALGLALDPLAAGGDARAAERLALARAQLERIDQTLRGFLALAAGSGARAERLRLRPLVDDVVLEASQRADGRLRFLREGDAELPAVAAELRILLQTLVINAVEASPDGGSVRIAVQQDGERVVVDVDDDGPGVAADIAARLFQPHVSSKPAGAGMGLFLAERLARQRYRGAITLMPRAPAGTRARLELRARDDAAPRAAGTGVDA